jgi:hypothetical protein
MSTSDDPRHEELHALRTRAYGPHADIHEDAAALARLRELEAHLDGEVGESPIHAQAAQERLESTTGQSAEADAGHASVEPGGDASPPGPPVVSVESAEWWRRRIPVLWTAAGVVVGLVLGMGGTLLLHPASAGQVAVLPVDADTTTLGAPTAAAPTPSGSQLALPDTQPVTDAETCAAIGDVHTITLNADNAVRDGRMVTQEQQGWYRLAARTLAAVPTRGEGPVSDALAGLQEIAPVGGVRPGAQIGSDQWNAAARLVFESCQEAGGQIIVESYTGG